MGTYHYKQKSSYLAKQASRVGKMCTVAWQTTCTDHRQVCRHTRKAESILRYSRTSKLLLDLVLSPELKKGNYQLIGIGYETVVLRSNQSQYVLKKSIDAYGAEREQLEIALARSNENNQLLAKVAKEIYVPTSSNISDLHLRPFGTKPTLVIEQPFIDAASDIKYAKEALINTDNFQNDLEQLIIVLSTLQEEGRILCLSGYGNIAVERHTNHIRILDSGLVRKYSPRKMENFKRRCDMLQTLRR